MKWRTTWKARHARCVKNSPKEDVAIGIVMAVPMACVTGMVTVAPTAEADVEILPHRRGLPISGVSWSAS